MRIILIGFMGCGKSSTGAFIAQSQGFEFKDLDTEIINRANGLSIADIFEKEGESSFRERERSAALELQDLNELVIATGGGAPLFKDTLEALRAKGSQSTTVFVWLDLSFTQLQRRIAQPSTRPLLADQEKAKKLFEYRYPLYESIADIRISVNENDSVEQVAQNVIDLINKRKRVVIIGSDPSNSLSPRMHNAAYKKCRIDDQFFFDFSYLKYEQVDGFLNQARSKKYAGVTVTIPFKESVIPFLDTLSAEAQSIGAVNTVVVRDQKLHGHNTDWYGVIKPLQDLLGALKDKKVLVLGAGGAARAAVWGLTAEGANVAIHNRTTARALRLAQDFSCHALKEYSLNDYDIIINTIPPQSISTAQLSGVRFSTSNRNKIFFDMNYGLEPTQLIQDATDLGYTTIDGREMLLWQGVRQFELYTQSSAPVSVMRNSIRLT